VLGRGATDGLCHEGRSWNTASATRASCRPGQARWLPPRQDCVAEECADAATNPVFFFGYLATEPSDEQLAHWVDAGLRVCVAGQVSVRPNEIDISRKLLGGNPRTVAVLASHNLKVACPTDDFDAGAHHAAEAADEVLRHWALHVGGRIQPVAANAHT